MSQTANEYKTVFETFLFKDHISEHQNVILQVSKMRPLSWFQERYGEAHAHSDWRENTEDSGKVKWSDRLVVQSQVYC